jgi:endo-1,4-beta-xylanase
MQQPDWHKQVKGEAEMRKYLDDWIRAFYARYGKRLDRVHCIEALNEPLSQPAGYRGLLGGKGETGWDWVIYTYQRARALADEAGLKPKLILNEWGADTPGQKHDQFRAIAKLLVDRNLVDVIGLQGHFLEGAKPEAVKKALDSMASLGRPLFITEFELDIGDDVKHLKQTQAIFPVMWEHPAVAGVTMWGHRQGVMWRKNGYLVRQDGSERPTLTWMREYLAAKGYPGAQPAAP